MSSCSGNCSTCGSDCADRKAESLLAKLNPRSSVKKVIAVVSGKGGVGKSTVTSMLAVAMARQGKRVAVPKVYGDEMKFIYLDDLTQIAKGYAGIPEPVADEPVACDRNALVLMPGLAFDHQGHRIGYGGGFYDKFLAKEPNHPTLALCYDFQMLPALETDDFDIPVDCVLWA